MKTVMYILPDHSDYLCNYSGFSLTHASV